MKQQIELRKSITWVKGSALTIGAILGSGILVLPAIAAQMAGLSSILSWLLMGLFSVPMVIAIGMMSSQFPNSDGMAAYARQAFGPFWGRLTGLLILSTMPLGMPIGARYLGSAFLGFIICYIPISQDFLDSFILRPESEIFQLHLANFILAISHPMWHCFLSFHYL